MGWLYNDASSIDPVNPNNCTKELVYDVQLKAFYKYSHTQKSSDSPYVVAPIQGRSVTSSTETQGVVVDADPVQVNGATVNYPQYERASTPTKIKYLTYVPSGTTVSYTVSDYNDTAYLDWDTEDFSSYLVTGHNTFQDMARNKGIPYLVTHFIRTENGFDSEMVAQGQSSCMIQSKWDWTNGSGSNRWGTPFQAYRYKQLYIPSGTSDTFTTGYEMITTKNKLRGRGKSVNLSMTSETGKEMYIVGWAMSVVGGSKV